MKVAVSSLALGTVLAMAACTASEPAAETASSGHAPVAAEQTQALASTAVDTANADPGESVPVAMHGLPRVIVHKSPTCGCCGAWVEHLRDDGFAVEVRETDDLEPVKSRVGVPFAKGSCHTAEVDGYFIEGHVPASDIRRLLAERPDARGLTLPGMPIGSPGMESPDGRVQPYTVEIVARDGTTAPYAHHAEAIPRTGR